MTQKELNELKLERIPAEDLEFSLEEQKVAYLFYLMNKGYTYEEKIKTLKASIDRAEKDLAKLKKGNK